MLLVCRTCHTISYRRGVTGRPTVAMVLTPVEREALQAWTRLLQKALPLPPRARVVLECAVGVANKVVAQRLSITPQAVSKWRVRCTQWRLDGLVGPVFAKTLEKKPKIATYWSVRSMAHKMGRSQTAVGRIWRAFGLQRYLQEMFKRSSDPLFVEKVREIVGLYLDPQVMAMVVRVDESGQIQPLDRSWPRLPRWLLYVLTNFRGYLPRTPDSDSGEGCAAENATAIRWRVAES